MSDAICSVDWVKKQIGSDKIGNIFAQCDISTKKGKKKTKSKSRTFPKTAKKGLSAYKKWMNFCKTDLEDKHKECLKKYQVNCKPFKKEEKAACVDKMIKHFS